MKKWVLMLGVSFLCFSSFATDYEFADLDLYEVRENRRECMAYTNHTIKYYGKGLSSLVNCIAYNIDKGVKPICEEENLAKEELERSNDENYTYELNIYLSVLENQKQDFVDDIYKLSERVFKICDEREAFFDEINKELGVDDWLSVALGYSVNNRYQKDCESFYKAMNNKETVYLDLKECEFSRFNHRLGNLYLLLLKMFRNNSA